MSVGPESVLVLASGLLTLALAVLLVAIDPARRANRALALLLFFRALTSMTAYLVRTPDDHWAATFQNILPYVLIPVVPAALYFVTVHPRPRTFLARPWGPWAILGVTLVFEAAYFLDHSLFVTTAPGEATVPLLQAAQATATSQGLQYVSFGPLFLLAALQLPVMAALSIPLARDYMHSAPGTPRFSSFLVAAGFLLNGIFDGTRAAFGLTSLPGAEYPWLPWGWGVALLPSLSLIPAVAAFVMILRHRFRQRDLERGLERRLILAVTLAALTAVAAPLLSLVMAVRADAGVFANPLSVVMVGIWRLALPVLVSYALFRYALFDCDARVRRNIRRFTVAAIFGGAYFLASELIEGVVNETQGRIFGIAVAAVFTFALIPIQKVSTWVAQRALPATPSARDVHGRDAVALYREHYAMVSMDGQVTERERRLLEGMRQASGLTRAQVAKVERQVDVVSRQPAPRATPA